MDYSREVWIKVYVRDTPGWVALSWQARGLALELSRKLDPSGCLPLGRRGMEALGVLLRAPWTEIRPFVEELVRDGRLVFEDGRVLDPDHAARQAACTSPAVRKKMQRDRDLTDPLLREELSLDVTSGHVESPNVTIREKEEKERIERERAREVTLATDPCYTGSNSNAAPLSARSELTGAPPRGPREFQEVPRGDFSAPGGGHNGVPRGNSGLTEALRRQAIAVIDPSGETVDVEHEWALYRADREAKNLPISPADWRKWTLRAIGFSRRERQRDSDRRAAAQARFGKAPGLVEHEQVRRPTREQSKRFLDELAAIGRQQSKEAAK